MLTVTYSVNNDYINYYYYSYYDYWKLKCGLTTPCYNKNNASIKIQYSRKQYVKY